MRDGPAMSVAQSLVALYLRGVAPTLRVREFRRPEGQGFVFAGLHGDQLVLAGSRKGAVAPLVSRSDDGELAAGVADRLGHRPIRGSTSKGGVSGFLGLRRLLRRSTSVFIAVDGPRGPAGRAAPGAVVLARSVDRPLVPVAAACRPMIRLRSWDALGVPLPFARVFLLYGRPVAPQGPRDRCAHRLEAALARLRKRAQRLLVRRR